VNLDDNPSTTKRKQKMTEQGMTFMAAWNCGGPLMWVLAGISVLALAVALYLIFSQRSAAIAPTDLVSDVMDRLRARDLAEARRLAERRSSAFSVLALAALDALAGASKGGASHVSQAIETAGSHVAERLQGAVDWLADLAAIAPLVGLLGTVLGMYQAFGGIANDLAANARPVVLAQGVSQAIITTMFGLVVSIPCLVFHAMLRRRAAKRISGLETLAVALEKAFA
jgi:biopolymer transport protein ExbB